MALITQQCSEEFCESNSAYRTRTKPAYCVLHIEHRFRNGGLELLDTFDKPTSWQLTRCLGCGLEAHYRFEYVIDNNGHGINTCRACYWRSWARQMRSMLGAFADLSEVHENSARALSEKNGLDYLRPLTHPSLSGDPHYVRCLSCERLSAQRLGDIGFGCLCFNSSQRASPAQPASRMKPLFKGSGVEAVTWWDSEFNPPKLWATATPASRNKAHWACPTCGLGFTDIVRDMAKRAVCPHCARVDAMLREIEEARRATLTIFDIPELLAVWADQADPRTVPASGDWTRRQLVCSEGHHFQQVPQVYLEWGCPSCRGNETRAARSPLEAELASQWHPTLNTIAIARVADTSKRQIWWQDPECGHEWAATPRERHKRPRWRCPTCRTRLGSLAWHYPELAAEWVPSNPTSAWQVMPTRKTLFLPTWVCPNDPGHVWETTVAARVNGATCPECRVSGKSAVELAYRDAAADVFGAATSGGVVRNPTFRRRLSWSVDVGVEAHGRRVAIEYDGSYWHGDKVELDTEKSRDLLAAGFLVVRLREDPLPSLHIDDDHYLEVAVYAAAPAPEAVMAEIALWVEAR